MNPITQDDALTLVLDGLFNDRLALLAGAGLSMAPPSSLPGAGELARRAKEKFDAQFAGLHPPLPVAIEDQAQWFYARHELGSVYLTNYIDHHAFAGSPNQGHITVADLLLSRAMRVAITTNVDTLVEVAGMPLLGQVFVSIDGISVCTAPAGTSPLLKLHGCWQQDKGNTVWARGQLEDAPVRDRIASSAAWLETALQNKDLLIVGYSTDWDYLNEVLERTLDRAAPSSVLVVDPAGQDSFAEKAPALAELAARATKGGHFLQASGADFLADVRRRYSQIFVRSAIAQGVTEFERTSGASSTNIAGAPDVDSDSLWRMRRDLLGCGPNEPATRRDPPHAPLVGLTILELRNLGAVAEGSYWRVDDRKVRVLSAPNTFLHEVQCQFERETAPIASADIIVAVGAVDTNLPASIARQPDGSVARGPRPQWVTQNELKELLA